MQKPMKMKVKKEQWRQHPEFTDYFISSYGRACSTKYMHLMQTSRNHAHMIRFHFYQDGKAKQEYAARSILRAFGYPPPTDQHRAVTIDHNPSNLYIDNLKWLSPSEMAERRKERRKEITGFIPYNTKLAPWEVACIRVETTSASKLAKRFGINEGTVSTIRAYESWKDLDIETCREIYERTKNTLLNPSQTPKPKTLPTPSRNLSPMAKKLRAKYGIPDSF